MDFLKLSKLQILTSIENLIEEYECLQRRNPDLRSLLVKLRKLIVYGDPHDKTFDRNIAKTYGQTYDSSSEDDDDDLRQNYETPNYFSSSLTSLPSSQESLDSSDYPRKGNNSFSSSWSYGTPSVKSDYTRSTDGSEIASVSSRNASVAVAYTCTAPRFSHYSVTPVPNTEQSQRSSSTSFNPVSASRDIDQERRLKKDRAPPVKVEAISDSEYSSDFSDSGRNDSFKESEDYHILKVFDQLCHRCYNPGHIVKDCKVSKEEGKLLSKLYFFKHPEVKAAVAKRRKEAILNDPVRRARKSKNTRLRLQRRRLKLINSERFRPTQSEKHNQLHTLLEPVFSTAHILAQSSFTQSVALHQSAHVHFHTPAMWMDTGKPYRPNEHDNWAESTLESCDRLENDSNRIMSEIVDPLSFQLSQTLMPNIESSASTSREGPTKFCFNCRTSGHLKVECPLPKSYGVQLRKQYLLEHPEKKNKNKKRKHPIGHLSVIF